MARISIELPCGVVGDIVAALLRSGFSHSESAELAELITTNSSVGFQTNKLAKAGIDQRLLVQELRTAGLVVDWSGEA